MTTASDSAFPSGVLMSESCPYQRGLSRRDYFAALAMQGLASDVSGAMAKLAARNGVPLTKVIAGVARELADALEAELKLPTQKGEGS